MKRIGNLYKKIYDINNLKLADSKARKGKLKQRGIINHDVNKEANIINLYHILKNKEYRTSKYTIFTIFDPKEREIFRLPYYPDRILHHAVLNILESILVKSFTKDTYSCIKKRGIHKALYSVKKALVDKENTQYCLKFDIQKFYPSINHNILKSLLRRKFKDKDLLKLLDEIIESAKGCPIGNLLSQWFANFYLSGFDHWIKENKRIKYYFRYCDDCVILAKTKEELHVLFKDIKAYLKEKLDLTIKSNYQIFPISKRGLDFLGYKCWHTHTFLRDTIKRNFIRMIRYHKNNKSINSYKGWISHCNGINLTNKYILNGQKNRSIKTIRCTR